MTRNTEKKNMSYLDKIKKSRSRIESREPKVKKAPEPRISVIRVNGAHPPKIEPPKEKESISIKVTASEADEADSEKSAGTDSQNLFGRKSGGIKLDSDKAPSEKEVELTPKKADKNKRSRFHHKRTESKSQREHLKLVVKSEPKPSSQRRLKTSSKGEELLTRRRENASEETASQTG